MVALLGASADVSLSSDIPRVSPQTLHSCLRLLLWFDPLGGEQRGLLLHRSKASTPPVAYEGGDIAGLGAPLGGGEWGWASCTSIRSLVQLQNSRHSSTYAKHMPTCTKHTPTCTKHTHKTYVCTHKHAPHIHKTYVHKHKTHTQIHKTHVFTHTYKNILPRTQTCVHTCKTCIHMHEVSVQVSQTPALSGLPAISEACGCPRRGPPQSGTPWAPRSEALGVTARF